MKNKPVALIPAYNPSNVLLNLVKDLISLDRFAAVVVINDGSLTECEALFKKITSFCTVLTHSKNQGKGAALKTGMRHVLSHHSNASGVITIDADGQHIIEDICKVAKTFQRHSSKVILGVRCFKENNIPFRSRIGNQLTRILLYIFMRLKLSDTQTGLRAIPYSFLSKLLNIKANRYEFELDMLLLIKKHKIDISECPISTIYLEGNKSSHFNPILDSLKIYFVLFRFTLIAIFSAGIDYGIFFLLYFLVIPKIWLCLVVGRFLSMLFNYFAVKHYAFYSQTEHVKAFPKYFGLVCLSTLLGYGMISGFTFLGLGIVWAKLISEILMFCFNFIVQKFFIF